MLAPFAPIACHHHVGGVLFSMSKNHALAKISLKQIP